MIPEFIWPSFVNENDPDTIQQRMMEELPPDIDTMPGGFPWDFTRPTANEKSQLVQFHLVQTLMLMFPMWAWDEWLDHHAAIAGLHRREASFASGKLTVIGLEGTVIAKDTVFATAATDIPSIEFKTEIEYTIPEEGTIEIDIVAVEAGPNSNVSPYTITLMSKPVKGVTRVYNEYQTTGGSEIEDDDTLRVRIQEANESRITSFVGNDSDYIRWAKEIPGVGSVVVIPEWNGPGTVKLVLVDANGRPANDNIIDAVYNYIVSPNDRLQRLAPIGAVVSVTQPEVIYISYTCKVRLKVGYEMNHIIEQFRQNLLPYYEEAKNEGVLKFTKVCAVLSNIEGVADFHDMRINGKDHENMYLEVDEYPETLEVDFEEI